MSSNSSLYGIGSSSTSLAATGALPFITVRNPTSGDLIGPAGNFAVGQIWVNSVLGSSFQLTGLSSFNGMVSAAWAQLTAGAGGGIKTINTILPDGGGDFEIVAGSNITITPGTNSISIAATDTTGIVTIDGSAGGSVTGNTVTINGGVTGLETFCSGTIMSIGGTLNVASGGTGDTSFTAFAPICGGSTTTGVLQSATTGFGSSGFVLTSTGASSLPTWQANAPGTGIVTIDGDTGSVTGATVNIYGNTAPAASGLTFTSSGTTLALGGVLNVANGGTGDNNLEPFGVLCGGVTSTSQVQAVSGLGSLGQVLTSQGAGILPGWANPSGAITGTTFTPTLTFGGGSTGLAGTSSGYYLTVGTTGVGLALMYFSVIITLTNKGSSTGAAIIGGLPFQFKIQDAVFPVLPSNVTVDTGYAGMMAEGLFNTTTMALFECPAAGTAGANALTDANFDNNTILVISGIASV